MKITILFREEEYNKLLEKNREADIDTYLHKLLEKGLKAKNIDFMYAYCLDFPKYRNTEIALNSKEITEINKIKNEPEYKGYLRIGEGELTKYLILKGLKSESEKEKQNFKE